MASIYSRPQVGSRVHILRECQVGRYLSSNLCTLMWCERFLQYTDDREMVHYNTVKKLLQDKNIYL